MSKKLAVVGEGLTGLFAANLAVDAGLETSLVARGRGSLSLSHGCIGILDRSNPSRSKLTLPPEHPYHKVEPQAFKQAFIQFQALA